MQPESVHSGATATLLEPLFTGAPREVQERQATPAVLPPLRIGIPPSFPPDAGSEERGEVGMGDPLRRYLTPSAPAAPEEDGVTTEEEPIDSKGDLEPASVLAKDEEGAPAFPPFEFDGEDELEFRSRAARTAPAVEGEERGADWRDDSPTFSMGAEPEDELPLLDSEGAAAGQPGTSVAHATILSATSAAAWPDPARLDEIAERLEGIARSLRDQDSAGSLVAQAKDPLGALITGYLLGYFEGTGGRGPSSSG